MRLSNTLMEKQAVISEDIMIREKCAKRRGLKKKSFDHDNLKRLCRFEELEKRELLAVEPITVGAAYVEQVTESQGDKFYVAWVGGESGTGTSTLDSVTINLDKNGNGQLDNNEAFFDTESGGRGVYECSPFKVVEATEDITYNVDVQDGGMTLKISFSNFHAGDTFIFTVDVDEYQDSESSDNSNAIYEGNEFGGHKVPEYIAGSTISMTFSSTHYKTATWNGMYLEYYDNTREYENETGMDLSGDTARPKALAESYDSGKLAYDADDGGNGIMSAGIYGTLVLTPKPITISGYVYGDHNVDCNYDVGEDDPLANVTVSLYNNGELIATTKTNEAGYYEFGEDLDLDPDTYDVYCQTKVPAPDGQKYFYDFCAHGGTFGEKQTPLHIIVSDMQGGDDAPDNNFSKVLPGSLDGYVFEDHNNANNYDEGDEPIVGVTVELWKLQNGVWTYLEEAVTNDDGYYRFEIDGSWVNGVRKNVNETYEVREKNIPEKYTDGTDYIGTVNGSERGEWNENDVFTNIYIGYNEDGIDYNFGELMLGSIAGNVFEDRNDNGVFDPEESGIADVTVDLFRSNGDGTYTKIDSMKTAEDGSYCFNDLMICLDYAVREHQPDDYDDGQDHLGTLGGIVDNDGFSQINVGWDQHGYEYDFGELKLGSIAGNVYEDRNDNGIIDPGEPGIDGVLVDLYVWQDNDYVFVQSVKTDADGSYQFDKLDIRKEYAVKEHQPEDFTDGKDAVGTLGGELTDDYISAIPVNWDDHGFEYNFGELKLGSIAGNVYYDANKNGIFDPEEHGLENVTVELYVLNDKGEYEYLDTTKTASDGSYEFTNLDINQKYAVKEYQPEGYLDGSESIGTLGGTIGEDYMYDISVKWDDHGYEYNFGEILPDPVRYGGLSGYVYVDANKNGVKDPGESGINNVTMTLYVQNEDGEYISTGRTTLTDSIGYYQFFDLDSDKTYKIAEAQPTGYDDYLESVGTLGGITYQDDTIQDIYVGPGEYGYQYNFGEVVHEDPDNPPDYPGTPGRTYNTTLPATPAYSGSNPGFNYIIETPINMEHTVTYFGGGGAAAAYSWHLSVVNGGYPRSVEANNSTAGYRAFLNGEKGNYMNVAFSTEQMKTGQFLIRANDGSVASRYVFGTPEALPVVGDWDGDGIDNIGVYVAGHWYLDRNGDGIWTEDDLWAELGGEKDQPVAGDWDGDGKADIGIFGPQWAGDSLAINLEPGLPADLNRNETFTNVSRPKNVPPEFNNGTLGHRTLVHRNNGQMRLDLIDHVFEYGHEGDYAVTGDWNGDGVAKIGVYRGGKWYLDVNGNGQWDKGDVLVENFDEASGVPVVGDFNGDGIDEIGLFNEGKWTLDTTGDYKPDTQFDFGQAGDKPYTGDFNGDGKSEVGVYRPGEAKAAPANSAE